MYLPPLFPVLLRTTGAGFCYNIGRLAAAVGTVIFGLFSKVGDYRIALLCAVPSSCRRRSLPCGSPISLSRSGNGIGECRGHPPGGLRALVGPAAPAARLRVGQSGSRQRE